MKKSSFDMSMNEPLLTDSTVAGDLKAERRWYKQFACGLGLLAATFLALFAWAVAFKRCPRTTDDISVDSLTKGQACGLFQPSSSCTAYSWVGVYSDAFSPDDTCPLSKRFIQIGRGSNCYGEDGLLHTSASDTDAGCTSTWGR